MVGLVSRLVSRDAAPASITPEPLRSAATSSLATIDLLESIDFAGYLPANGAIYPAGAFGQSLRSIAAMIKAGIDLEAAQADLGGWDLHNQLGPIDGTMAGLLANLAAGLEAFYLDMLGDLDRVVVVVMSEFGRRIAQNGTAGVDHGHGNAMLVMGGHIAGGQVVAQWPGLSNDDQGDLAITIDYRDILAEILQNRMGATDLASVFPGYTPNFQGVTA